MPARKGGGQKRCQLQKMLAKREAGTKYASQKRCHPNKIVPIYIVPIYVVSNLYRSPFMLSPIIFVPDLCCFPFISSPFISFPIYVAPQSQHVILWLTGTVVDMDGVHDFSPFTPSPFMSHHFYRPHLCRTILLTKFTTSPVGIDPIYIVQIDIVPIYIVLVNIVPIYIVPFMSTYLYLPI